jgi:zinc protease
VNARSRWRGCLLAAILLAAPAGSPASDLTETTLPNGLRVVLQEDWTSPLVSLQIWYRVGSRNEQIGRSGLSHYLEHMMFKGTTRHGPGAYARAVEELGGRENAFTTPDATAYYVDVSADRIDLILDLEADRMRNLRLDPRDVESERKVIMEERRTRTEDDPIGTLAEEFNAVAFLVHPYRIPPIGFMTDIERVSAADLRRWYDIYYQPQNAILLAVGAFRTAEMLDRIRARFGAIPRGPDPPEPGLVEPEPRGERRVFVRKEAQLPVIFVGYPAPTLRSADAYPLEVLSTLLSAGRASRLHRRLVHEGQLALDAGGDYSMLSLDPTPFTFYATALPGKTTAELEAALAAEVERLREEPVDDEELQRAKNQLEAGFLFGQDSTHARASTLARYALAGRVGLKDEFLPKIRAVTRDDVQRVARRYFGPDRRTTAILVPTPPAEATPGR